MNGGLMIPPMYLLTLSAIIFLIGTAGFLVRRNALIMFMSLELMFNAVNLTFVTFSRFFQQMDGEAFVLFIMAVAAAEAAVGLAIIITLFRNKETVKVDDVDLLKG
jgi:NADH-quinone oxidoreductase subunit K